MSLKITKGLKPTAVRAVFYGVEGVGKTSLAALLPEPLFFDLEEGSHQLDVARVSIDSFATLESSLAHLAVDTQGYKTLVIDSADWAERLRSEALLKKHAKKSIEDFGFGKGFVMLAEEMARALEMCDALVHRGLNVVWIAHAKTVRVSPPDMVDGFDRYELKMSKQVAPLFKEWADLLLFANYETIMVKGNDGRVKGSGGQNRFLHTERNAAWDAKNRYGLPPMLPMVHGSLPAELAAVFAGKVMPVATAAQSTAVAQTTIAETAPQRTPITDEQRAKLGLYAGNSVAASVIAAALDHYVAMDIGELDSDQAEKVIARCQEEMNKEPAKPKAPAPKTDGYLFPRDIAAHFSAHEEKVNAFLVSKKWITTGQSFRDVTHEKGDEIVKRIVAFAKSAGIPAITAGQEVAA